MVAERILSMEFNWNHSNTFCGRPGMLRNSKRGKPMLNQSKSRANLRRRLEAVEASLAIAEEAAESIIQDVLFRMSPGNLDFLIDATLASRQGRELTEREIAADQEYITALEAECRWRRVIVRRRPEAPRLISTAIHRRLSEEELRLCASGIRTILRFDQPTASELAALRAANDAEEAQYQRAGFSSVAEFKSWYGSEDTTRADSSGPSLTTKSALSRLSDEEGELSVSGIHNQLRGNEPTASELAALRALRASMDAELLSPRFSSEADYERWHAAKYPAPADGVGTKIER